MTQYTEEEIEERVREAVERTERSFGGTFKRLKSENEELRTAMENSAAEREATAAAIEAERRALAERLEGLERETETHRVSAAELAVKAEIERHLRETGPIPERFIDRAAIVWDDDPDTFRANVREAVERGRKEFEEAIAAFGVIPDRTPGAAANPTNPPTRSFRDLRRAGAREMLAEMRRRGLIR
jgi:hypothetical protein